MSAAVPVETPAQQRVTLVSSAWGQLWRRNGWRDERDIRGWVIRATSGEKVERRRRLNTFFLCRTPPPPPRSCQFFRLDVSVNERECRFVSLPRGGRSIWRGRRSGGQGGLPQRFVYVAREQLEAVARLIHKEPLAVKSHKNKHLLLKRVTTVHPPASAINSSLSWLLRTCQEELHTNTQSVFIRLTGLFENMRLSD